MNFLHSLNTFNLWSSTTAQSFVWLLFLNIYHLPLLSPSFLIVASSRTMPTLVISSNSRRSLAT
ncbi:hypothetical protein BDQ12DRAFT_684387 [Crucibulum laeve]|uniref:Uncharacterized protein n=1 Tax=Crucibulum laeve TaxID=68775 RepID=A0A5C3LZU4_9AGAR|nr:hypothetical protein BDQ12DRAFT_684387 [Crucibulum laeve]